MSETLTKVIVDCSTGIVAEVPLTGEEIAQREVDAAQAEVERAERTTQAEALATLKASAKAKLVAGQPLTTEEAAVLVI